MPKPVLAGFSPPILSHRCHSVHFATEVIGIQKLLLKLVYTAPDGRAGSSRCWPVLAQCTALSVRTFFFLFLFLFSPSGAGDTVGRAL